MDATDKSVGWLAERLAREIPGAFRPNQFANPQNPEAHYRTTGPEIWEDTEGKVDVFVAGSAVFGAAKDSDPHRYDSIIAALRAELGKVR